MLSLLGSLVGAGSSLLGGLFGQQNNQANIQANQQIDAMNIAAQRDFAQHGIQWRVDDAKAAGINPLAALGANTTSFSNVAGQPAQDNSFGTGVANAGQDISRAMQAMQSPEQQAAAEEKSRLDLESLSLDNELKRSTLMSSLRRANQPGQPPGLPDPRKTLHFPPDAQIYVHPGTNRAYLMPSEEAQRSMWGNPGEESAWWWRNVAPQTFGYRIPADIATASPGRSQYLNPLTRGYYELPDVRTIIPGSGGRLDTTGMWDPFGWR